MCRWRDLPDLYSCFGSHGIILMTILQSWSQGKDVWGEAGMNKLWSAANIRTCAGGIAEEEFLTKLSRLVGRYDQVTRSTSTRAGATGVFGGGGVQTSRQLHRETIFDVDDPAALPRGRALVLSSGNRPTLVATIPWMDGPHAPAIRASITAHDPHTRQSPAARSHGGS